MSTADIILYVALLFAFLVMGSILTFAFLVHQRLDVLLGQAKEDAVLRRADDDRLLTEEERQVWEADEEPKEPPAVPLDPSNPPVPRTFNPSADRDPRDYPVCNCHDRRLTAGEEILWWPQPDGSVMIFHPDFIAQAAKAT